MLLYCINSFIYLFLEIYWFWITTREERLNLLKVVDIAFEGDVAEDERAGLSFALPHQERPSGCCVSESVLARLPVQPAVEPAVGAGRVLVDGQHSDGYRWWWQRKAVVVVEHGRRGLVVSSVENSLLVGFNLNATS